jgi:hypothetical protein
MILPDITGSFLRHRERAFRALQDNDFKTCIDEVKRMEELVGDYRDEYIKK